MLGAHAHNKHCILSILVLQRPGRKARNKELSVCLERRLMKWKDGGIESFVLEGRTLQQRLPKFKSLPTSVYDNIMLMMLQPQGRLLNLVLRMPTLVKVTSERRPFLGGAIGSDEFVINNVNKKVAGWSEDLKLLSGVAVSQPHAT